MSGRTLRWRGRAYNYYGIHWPYRLQHGGTAIPRNVMKKPCLAVLLLLATSVPALAKPKDDYPVPCNILWTAVRNTLSNPSNYSILGISDSSQNAAFKIVGSLVPYTDRVALMTRDSGCSLKLAFIEVGSDNADLREFRKGVTKSLAKIEAAKPPMAPVPGVPVNTAPGQQ